jgi:hypothetical protein
MTIAARALTVAVLLLLALPAAASAAGSCWPKGTKTLQHSKQARVYSIDLGNERRTYGCLHSTGRRVALDQSIDGDAYIDSEPPYRLAGRYVAHKAAYAPQEAYQSWEYGVDVVDLRTGRVRRSARAAWDDGEPYDPENPPDPRFSAFVLTTSGSAAWIASWGDPQAWRLDSRGPKLLDQGKRLSALRVTDGRVSWVNGETRKSASFR